MLILIDNYDSFTYNLFQYLSELGEDVRVYRNDRIEPEDILDASPQYIVISPGPGTPDRAGVSIDVIRKFGGIAPILGVCLGLQCIVCAYGGEVGRADEIRHGKSSLIYHDGMGVLSGLPCPFGAIRYHSLVVVGANIPECLQISAWTDDGVVMGLRHRTYPLEGVQFHPESIMTQEGKKILKNFLEKRGVRQQ